MINVTLINDWQKDSLYLTMIKAKLLSIADNLNIIDLTSTVKTDNIVEAAFILKHTFMDFPANTIHLNFIKNNIGQNSEILIYEKNKQFIITPNNGFLSLIFSQISEEIYSIQSDNTSFFELNLYTNIVEAILKKNFKKIAKQTTDIFSTFVFQPTVNHNFILGNIIYIDIYGNLITNITKELVVNFIKGRKFKIIIQSEKNTIDKINISYDETQSSELLAIINSLGYLELAQKDGNMAKILSITKKDQVRIEFYEKPENSLF